MGNIAHVYRLFFGVLPYFLSLVLANSLGIPVGEIWSMILPQLLLIVWAKNETNDEQQKCLIVDFCYLTFITNIQEYWKRRYTARNKYRLLSISGGWGGVAYSGTCSAATAQDSPLSPLLNSSHCLKSLTGHSALPCPARTYVLYVRGTYFPSALALDVFCLFFAGRKARGLHGRRTFLVPVGILHRAMWQVRMGHIYQSPRYNPFGTRDVSKHRCCKISSPGRIQVLFRLY